MDESNVQKSFNNHLATFKTLLEPEAQFSSNSPVVRASVSSYEINKKSYNDNDSNISLSLFHKYTMWLDPEDYIKSKFINSITRFASALNVFQKCSQIEVPLFSSIKSFLLDFELYYQCHTILEANDNNFINIERVIDYLLEKKANPMTKFRVSDFEKILNSNMSIAQYSKEDKLTNALELVISKKNEKFSDIIKKLNPVQCKIVSR